MKLKITKVMLNEIKKFAKNDNELRDYNFSFLELKPEAYSYYVDYDVYKHDIDYDYIKNKYKTICVEYPYNYYATDSFITTKMLVDIYNKGNNTLEKLLKALKEEIMI